MGVSRLILPLPASCITVWANTVLVSDAPYMTVSVFSGSPLALRIPWDFRGRLTSSGNPFTRPAPLEKAPAAGGPLPHCQELWGTPLGLRNHRQSSRLPSGKSASHLDQPSDPMLIQDAGGDGRAVAPCAMEGNAVVAGEFTELLLQMVQRNVHAAFNMPCGPFARISDIQQQRRVGARQLHLGARSSRGLGKIANSLLCVGVVCPQSVRHCSEVYLSPPHISGHPVCSRTRALRR
jgi:hypothetical protein